MLLELDQITKHYGSTIANKGIDFTLREGEVHALIGENGAGKTTLMRILYGMEQPTSGSIRIRGKDVRFANPSDAIASGIGMVHQHFMLFPSFTVAENIVIGREPKAKLQFDRKAAAEQVKQLSEQYGMPVDPWARADSCSLGVQQRIEILKVLHQGADIIILDEPTGVLTPLEVKELLDSIKRLAAQGKSFIIISHKLQEIMDVADRITVLRDGKVTGVLNAADTDEEQLSRLMVGRELSNAAKSNYAPGAAVIEVAGLSVAGPRGGKPLLDDIHFTVREGEIVGIAGISGNGQSELIEALTGLRRITSGSIKLVGEEISSLTVQDIRSKGLAHIPEDRYLLGAAKEETVADNGLMGHAHRHSRNGLLRGGGIRKLVRSWVEHYRIKTASTEAKAGSLSGGNLQKLIVAREMAHGTPFVIAAEPTRGVDIGAMEVIHDQLLQRRDERGGVLLISSELTEILKLADRMLVMSEGRIVGELTAEDATEEKISLMMAGGRRVG